MNTHSMPYLISLVTINLSSLIIISPMTLAQEYGGCFMIGQSGELINLSEFCGVTPSPKPSSQATNSDTQSQTPPENNSNTEGGDGGAPEIPKPPDAFFPSSPTGEETQNSTPTELYRERLYTPSRQQLDLTGGDDGSSSNGGSIPTFR